MAMIAFAGPRFAASSTVLLDTTCGVPSWRRLQQQQQQQQHLERHHVTTTSTSTTTPTRHLSRPLATPCPSPVFIVPMFFPYLHRLHILPLSASPACLLISSFAHTSVLTKGSHFVHCRWSWSFCSWPISRLPVHVPLLCCCLHHVTIAIAVVGLCSGCSCCCCGVLVALGGKDVMVTKMLIKNLSRLLMMQKDCCGSGSAIAVLLLLKHIPRSMYFM